MSKDERAVKEIKEVLVKNLSDLFGYCGVAEGSSTIMLNSGDGNIVITIKWEGGGA